MWNSQSFFETVLTGQFIGKYGVDYCLNKSRIYVKTREAVASFFASKLSPRLDPISSKISDKLLLKLKQEKTSDWLFSRLAKTVVMASLEPLFKEIIKNGVRIFVQKQLEGSFDTFWEKGISLGVITTIYHLALSTLRCPVLGKNAFLKESIDLANQYLPSTTALLSVLTAFHVAEMVYVLWKTDHTTHEHNDENCNKEEVKQLILDQIRHPVKTALEDKIAYRTLGLILNEGKLDALIEFLTNEVIEHCYWEKLHQIRILNVPLLS